MDKDNPPSYNLDNLQSNMRLDQDVTDTIGKVPEDNHRDDNITGPQHLEIKATPSATPDHLQQNIAQVYSLTIQNFTLQSILL